MLTFDAASQSRQDEGMRKPRFKRVPPKSALQLRESGYQVLELLHQFKALRAHHIAMHLPHRHERGLSHSLRNLFDHGLIDKVVELRRFNALYQHDTYTLSGKGRRHWLDAIYHLATYRERASSGSGSITSGIIQ